jgi:hypothetical protein
MKKKIKVRKKIGYSLIEALVALGILLLGIVPVVTVATQAILFHHRASESEEAARISQTMIDYIKSKGYDELRDRNLNTPYTYTLTSTGSAFTIDKFATDFKIPLEMVLLNSKGINLSDVSFYINMETTKGDLEDYDRKPDSYTDPITGEKDKRDVYRKDLIYGKFIFKYGKNEMKTTFIITPIENWK